MITQEKLHPQFVSDAGGQRTAVLLPVAEYEELLEDLDDLAVAAERSSEKTIPHSQVVGELEADGIL